MALLHGGSQAVPCRPCSMILLGDLTSSMVRTDAAASFSVYWPWVVTLSTCSSDGSSGSSSSSQQHSLQHEAPNTAWVGNESPHHDQQHPSTVARAGPASLHTTPMVSCVSSSVTT
jgi:hypothetical protein